MDTQPLVQPPSVPFSSLPVSMGSAANKKDEAPARTDDKDEAPAAAERELYDNVACTD